MTGQHHRRHARHEIRRVGRDDGRPLALRLLVAPALMLAFSALIVTLPDEVVTTDALLQGIDHSRRYTFKFWDVSHSQVFFVGSYFRTLE